MSKIMIESLVYSSMEDNTIFKGYGIKKDDSIIYTENNTKVNILINENMIKLARENNDINYTLTFVKDKKVKTKYYIVSLNKYIDINVYTKELYINGNNIKIIYDLYMENQKTDEFIFELKWR